MISVKRDLPLEYRRRAEEARTKAKGTLDSKARQNLLQDADMWERMAHWEEGQPAKGEQPSSPPE